MEGNKEITRAYREEVKKLKERRAMLKSSLEKWVHFVWVSSNAVESSFAYTLLITPLSYNQLGTVNSLYCGHPRDRELASVIARVHNSRNLFQSNVCYLFLPGFSCCLYCRGVRNSEVSARWELSVLLSLSCPKQVKFVQSFLLFSTRS